MKKICQNFKFVILSLLVLVSIFGFIFNIKPTNTVQVAAAVLTPYTTNFSTGNLDDFSDAVMAMTSQYPIEDNALIFLHKERDLYQDSNGDYLINQETFSNLTNAGFEAVSASTNSNQMRACGTNSYDLEDLASENNYNVTEGEYNMILTRKYATRRLILQTTCDDLDFCGAVASARMNNLLILQYSSIEETYHAYDYFLTCDNIESVNVDTLCWIEEEDSVDENDVVPMGLDDSYSYETWGAVEMGVPEYSQYLKDIVDAKNTSYTKLPEVVVAVLDTGVDTDHPWFENRFLYDENGKIIGKDYTNINGADKYSFEDDDSHGTHCSGIICDMTLSNVKILPLKFMYKHSDGKSYGNSSHALLAMAYTIEMKKQYNIVAINMSFSGERSDSYYKSAINDLYNANIMPVAAAGNESHDASKNSPANVAKAITVSAITSKMKLSSFSNYGDVVDVCAPGSSINSAYIDGRTIRKSGTSMAAPHVAAYIALLKSDPSCDYTNTDLENILYGKYNGIQTLNDLGDPGKDASFGYGLPILTNLPNYVALDIFEPYGGEVSLSGLNFFSKKDGNEINLIFTPQNNCYVYGIYINGELQPYTKFIQEFDASHLSGHCEVVVEFGTKYKVNHYLEPLYDTNDANAIPEFTDYDLVKIETYYTQFNLETNAVVQEYTGFTPLEFEQQVVLTNDIELSIYYKRNKYIFTLNFPEVGFDHINGGIKEVLYGEEIALNPVLQENYEITTWEVNYCTDIEFLNELNLTEKQIFLMPASDLTITVKVKHNYVDWVNLLTWGGVIVIGIVVLMFITRPRMR